MTTTLVLPDRMKNLPKDSDGLPVPWYAAVVDGEPELRSVRENGVTDAVRFKSCWFCGKPNGKYAAFIIGAKGAVSRVASDPPGHRDCAQYAAQVYPSLAFAGASLVWVTLDWHGFRDPNGQPLFNLGDPDQAYWYIDGRDATRDEVLDSLDVVMPALRKLAAEASPLTAIQLEKDYGRVLELVPA